MKKITLLLVIAISLSAVTTNTANAQKIGYIRIDDVVGLMPELQKVTMDTVGQKFVQDSVLPRYNYLQSEYTRKLTEYTDSTKSPAVRAEILKDLQQTKAELDGAEGVIQQVQQYKQQELLQPYYAKAKKAIDQVAKEKGYAYVLSKDVFIVAPEGDDMTMAVLGKLNIKLPAQNPQGAPVKQAPAKPAAAKPKTN
jgi:outer membrane protein